MKINILYLIYTFTLVFTTVTNADEKTFQCMDSMKSIKFALQGVSQNNLTYSMKDDDETRYMLFVSEYDENNKDKDDNVITTWRLLERQGESLTYCLIGAGNTIELLSDTRGIKSTEKYGLPGSGHKRCTENSDGILAPQKIRGWANKELGKSNIQYFNSDIGNNDFTLINNIEGQGGKYPWILLNSQKNNPSSVCYYDRGDDITFQKNIAISSKNKYKVPTIKGIK